MAVRLEIFGQEISAQAGDTVMVAALRHGIVTLSRSVKYHRPRGAGCARASGVGECDGCLVRIDGKPSQRACEVVVQPGMRVRFQNAPLEGAFDPLALTDAMHPHGMDHHRMFTSTNVGNRLMQAAVRYAAGVGTLPDEIAVTPNAKIVRVSKLTLRAILRGDEVGLATAIRPFAVFTRPLQDGARYLVFAQVDAQDEVVCVLVDELDLAMQCVPRLPLLHGADLPGVFLGTPEVARALSNVHFARVALMGDPVFCDAMAASLAEDIGVVRLAPEQVVAITDRGIHLPHLRDPGRLSVRWSDGQYHVDAVLMQGVAAQQDELHQLLRRSHPNDDAYLPCVRATLAVVHKEESNPHKTFVCRCEDISLREVQHAIDLGHTDIESIKRFTGLGTGFCQGKQCVRMAEGILCAAAITPAAESGITPRPPLVPVTFGKLAALHDCVMQELMQSPSRSKA